VCASACVCACVRAMCLCAYKYAGVCQRAGVRVSVCVFPPYLQYVDRNQTSAMASFSQHREVGSCLFGSGTKIPAKKWGDTEIAERGRSVLVML